jgi:hypothetical protein
MALGHGCIHTQALNQQTVRDIFGDERQRNGLTLLYGDLGRGKRKPLGMNLNDTLSVLGEQDWRRDERQNKRKCD